VLRVPVAPYGKFLVQVPEGKATGDTYDVDFPLARLLAIKQKEFLRKQSELDADPSSEAIQADILVSASLDGAAIGPLFKCGSNLGREGVDSPVGSRAEAS
jgi:hypothetical protein